MKIPLDKIILDADRQRKDYGSPIESLQDPEVGLIQPLVVEPMLDGTYNLIAGGRRYTSAKHYGWTEIECVTRSGLDEVQRQKMEFIENVERKQLSWNEEVLAIYKLYHLLKRERATQAETWTVRAMASFCKSDKDTINRSLLIGEGLAVVPKDEELWAADGFYAAYEVIRGRNEKVLQAELERRKAIALATEQAALPLSTGPAVVIATATAQSAATAAASPVSNGDITPLAEQTIPMEEITIVYIHGRNYSYDDAPPGSLANTAVCVLAYLFKERYEENLHKDLAPNGWAILWRPEGGLDGDFPELVWNTTVPCSAPASTPFGCSHIDGFLIGPLTASFPEPQGSVITAMPDEDPSVLPEAVVEWSIRSLTTERMAVVLPCGVNPVHVAQHGRVPIFYEPNKELFDKKVKALTEFYQSIIPNVEVRLR